MSTFRTFTIGVMAGAVGCAVIQREYQNPAPDVVTFKLGAGDELGVATVADMSPEHIMTDFEFKIWTIESSRGHGPIWGEDDELGPLQITEEAWQDAIEHRPEIGGEWMDCQDLGYSLKIMRSYLDRWANAERCGIVNDQIRSRIWNGGPYGHLKEATLDYWIKFCHTPGL
jgi:hypothetical protein